MHRQQLEHIIRAAAGITGAAEFVIVGSQAVLGQFPQAPDELLISIEADVFSLRDPADSDFLVLWTRDPRPLMPHLGDLERRGIRFYAQMTVTGYPPAMEPGAPPLAESIDALRDL